MATHARCAGSRSRPKTLRNSRVRIPYAKPVSWVVRPSAEANASISTAEAIAVEESGVDEKAAAKPVRSPSPTAPTTPTAEEQSNIDPGPISETERRVIKSRIISVRGRSPNIHRIVLRHIDHLRVCWLDLDRRLAIIGLSRSE